MIPYLFAKFLRALFFWIPKSETEIALDRLGQILKRKQRLADNIFQKIPESGISYKNQIDELLKYTEETLVAMSDNLYVEHEMEIQHRKDLAEICNILISDLKDLKKSIK